MSTDNLTPTKGPPGTPEVLERLQSIQVSLEYHRATLGVCHAALTSDEDECTVVADLGPVLDEEITDRLTDILAGLEKLMTDLRPVQEGEQS